jgi:hypothetical protein
MNIKVGLVAVAARPIIPARIVQGPMQEAAYSDISKCAWHNS